MLGSKSNLTELTPPGLERSAKGKSALAACPQCGEEFKIFPYQVGVAKYCSRACKYAARSRELTGNPITHGMRRTREYRIWSHMKGRCHNPTDRSFRDYGARGIAVCERWHVFENFFADMGYAPPGTTIERRNNDGPYSPENCEWVPAAAQARNSRQNLKLTLDGETKTLAEWCAKRGVTLWTARSRLKVGRSLSEALSPEPIKSGPRPQLPPVNDGANTDALARLRRAEVSDAPFKANQKLLLVDHGLPRAVICLACDARRVTWKDMVAGVSGAAPIERFCLMPNSWEDAPAMPSGAIQLGLSERARQAKLDHDESDALHQADMRFWHRQMIAWCQRWLCQIDPDQAARAVEFHSAQIAEAGTEKVAA